MFIDSVAFRFLGKHVALAVAAKALAALFDKLRVTAHQKFFLIPRYQYCFVEQFVA